MSEYEDKLRAAMERYPDLDMAALEDVKERYEVQYYTSLPFTCLILDRDTGKAETLVGDSPYLLHVAVEARLVELTRQMMEENRTGETKESEV